ncbi:MAG: hypothetical protein ACT4P6_03740 [Gemmatimonadaceae bacterium]
MGEREQVLAIFGPRGVHEDYGAMLRTGGGTDQRSGEPNVSVRELDVFTLCDLDPSRRTWS